MRYQALACDYDETLAHESRMPPEVVAALERLRTSGRRLLLVTGRRLGSIQRDCAELHLFDRVVVENGAIVYDPRTGKQTVLADPVPLELDRLLAERGVSGMVRGTVLVGAMRVWEAAVLESIATLGVPLDVIYNKDSLMVLPHGVDKASGLAHALRELGIAPEATVGVGDAENDLCLLGYCGLGVAVANALPHVKEQAGRVMTRAKGAGVVELIETFFE